MEQNNFRNEKPEMVIIDIQRILIWFFSFFRIHHIHVHLKLICIHVIFEVSLWQVLLLLIYHLRYTVNLWRKLTVLQTEFKSVLIKWERLVLSCITMVSSWLCEIIKWSQKHMHIRIKFKRLIVVK